MSRGAWPATGSTRVYNVSVRFVLIDFHTHTRASDGVLSPPALLALARARGVAMLAITDHDTVDGYRAVQRCGAAQAGVRLIAGVEFSCRWSATTVHIVGLGIECEHPAMRTALGVLGRARQLRGRTIAERLAARGMPGALEGALALADGSQLGRPHFAAWMVAQGHVADPGAAFQRFLGQGRPGDVKAHWPELATVVGWIGEAGGVAVLAHPCKYRFTGMKLRRLLVDFTAAGGRAIEVQSGQPNAQQFAHLMRCADEFKLEISAGSDFHREAPYLAPPGVALPRQQGLRGVWQRWAG